jgi:hypothetical protein
LAIKWGGIGVGALQRQVQTGVGCDGVGRAVVGILAQWGGGPRSGGHSFLEVAMEIQSAQGLQQNLW